MTKPIHVVFVLDTSASMMRPLNGALSALDAAKAAIEQFVQSRSRISGNARQDHYVLVTTEGEQTAWNATTEEFLNQMRQTRYGSSASIKKALDTALNFVNRYRSPVLDNYGQGFVPWFIMPCSFIVLTDGLRDMALPESSNKAKTPTVQHLYSDSFRWDYRVHVAVLTTGGVVQTPHRLADICQLLSGSFKVCSSLRAAKEFMEQLSQQTVPSVSIRLSCHSASATCPFVITQDKGNWPIPLSYLPNAGSIGLEASSPIPEFTLKPMLTPIDVASLNLPYDRYEVESGQFPNNIMPNQYQQAMCHVRNSLGDGAEGKPCALLTPTTLFVLPYNFPRLSRLIQDSMGASLSQQIEAWRLQLTVVPFYYLPALRMAFCRSHHLSHLVSEVLHGDNMAGALSAQIKSQISRLVQSQSTLLENQESEKPSKKILPRPIPGRRPDRDVDPAHEIPVSTMGNYQAALAAKPTLRDPLADENPNAEPLREDAHFGSRYRKTKKVSRRLSLSVDEADRNLDDLQPVTNSQARESITVQLSDVEGSSNATKPKIFVNYWKLAPLLWSFTELLTTSDFDPAYPSLLSNFRTSFEAARSNNDFSMLVQLCEEQASRYGNTGRIELLRSAPKSVVLSRAASVT